MELSPPMTSLRAMALDTSTAGVGVLLREWRGARRFSQFDLASEAEISARHLSCVESGKAQPSRDVVGRLASALGMPLRERNALFIAAGFAPEHRETSLDAPEMAAISQAIDITLNHHDPYPAFVVNRHWDVVKMNNGVARVFALLREGGPKHGNIVRQIFDPQDMRPYIANWEEVAGGVISHLHAEVRVAPADHKARALLKEALAFPDVPEHWRTREPRIQPAPLLTTHFRRGDLDLVFFSTLVTFSAARDVTLDELRIECMFPADEATAQICQRAR
jgi:transcriptional regulator with XRE-family HTH domain